MNFGMADDRLNQRWEEAGNYMLLRTFRPKACYAGGGERWAGSET